ncbi:abortive infection family protein [Brevibacillus sp. GCM10020057]
MAAHGRSYNAYPPTTRHAQLAVNLAISMADFLYSSWEEKRTNTYTTA